MEPNDKMGFPPGVAESMVSIFRVSRLFDNQNSDSFIYQESRIIKDYSL